MSGNFKFDSFKGRIATNGSASVPEGLSAPTTKDPAKVIWAQKPHPPVPGFWDDYPKNLVKKYQTFFQKPDGLPVHLKNGMKDRVMYVGVLGMTFVGTIWACCSLYQMTKKE